MKILFAAPDRDLLNAYKTLLTTVDDQVETAFDGPQVITGLAGQSWDLLILSEDIPRAGSARILEQCSSMNIPVILMTTDYSYTRKVAGGQPQPREYISLPFTPGELEAAIARAGERL